MKKYRVAVIGHTGKGNYGHGVDTVWLKIPSCEIVAVADADEAGRAAVVNRLKAPKGYADYRQMLDEAKADIVAIGPRWLDQHREMCLAAAAHGAHIYMEKPFCRSPAEADEIIKACEKADIKLALAHQTRYSPKLQGIRELIDDGKIGTILEFRGRGKEDKRGGGEDLWVLGSHIMNLIHHFGGEPNWCFARVEEGGQPIGKEHIKPGNEGIGPLAGDTISAMYGLDGGATAYFGSKRETMGNRFGLQIFGSKGIIEILTGHLPSAQFLPDPAWSPGRSKAVWQPISSTGLEPETMKDGGLDAGNVLAVQDLIEAIENDRQPECSMYEGRTTIEMICAVFESHRTGGPVKMPLATRVNPLSLV
ncbi:putative oxidoreductase YvaA [Anatilimnocola aggregata]|uniref:Putative oxidoreductase YvaA n=1 Tax=Anatilimnocola aggregata TaxID=2528021 RepID=A0A517Y899_9BACT|nr:Gfo/Idh/MocA family oxidoreductase [Anatilimnocola aggregata]QDU26479.1 putative oxidoreductase YvaA [Anatilimnocola aggregata]